MTEEKEARNQGKGQRDMAIADYEKFITLSDDPQWIQMVEKQIEELSKWYGSGLTTLFNTF